VERPGSLYENWLFGQFNSQYSRRRVRSELSSTMGVSMQNVPSSNTRPNWLAYFKVYQADDNAWLYAEATKNMPLGLSIWRLENPADARTFRLVLSNPAAGGAAGVSMEKFRGKTMVEAFPWIFETPIPKALQEVVLSGKARELGEIQSVDEYAPAGFFAGKAFSLRGNCVGVIFENITQGNEAAETVAGQAKLLDLANDAILVSDREGNMVYWNKGAERMYAWTAREALGKAAHELLQTEFPRPAEEIQEKLLREGHWEGELIQLKRDGSRITVASRWILQRDETGKPAGRLQFNTDITERRVAEKALQEARELSRQTTEVTLTSQMGGLLQTCLSLKEAYSIMPWFVPKLLPTESGALCMLNASRKLVEVVALWGDDPGGEHVFAPDDCWALRRGRVHSVDDSASAVVCRHLGSSPPASYLCVPLVAMGDTLGILHLRTKLDAECQPEAKREHFSASKQQLVMMVAEQIGLGLANLRLRDTLRMQSVRDPLTGLFNRRYMEESLERELRRAARKEGPLGIFLFDIDYFKGLNDSLGHEVGDTLLRDLGIFLQAHVRAEDVACRYGGDEFILILPNASLAVTRQRAEQLRETVKHLGVHRHGQHLGTITLSLGMAVYPEHGITVQALLRSADEALYRSKKQGGDRVLVGKAAN
jgi:diguanylate cyclase (GGDEF)-like protein/PAS domain S-box-containing protein